MEYKLDPKEIELLYLPERVHAEQVAKKIRIPSRSNILDRIDLELTPYLKDPISLIGKNQVEWIIIIAPTQSGKTVFLQVAVADAIDQDPGTMMYILPDENSVKRQFKEKILDMIRLTECLHNHVTGPRSLGLNKVELDNMSIYPSWSGSLASLSSTPVKRVILDEVRLMKLQIGEESNAIKLAEDRLTTFKSMGLAQGYMVSTPSIEGDLLHQQLDVYGTKVFHWVHQCPGCGSVTRLNFFKNVKKNEDGLVSCQCLQCGYKFKDSDKKMEMNNHAFYQTKDGEVFDINEPPKRIVFWFDSLSSPFRSFESIFTYFLETKDKIQDYKNFIQAWLAKFWVQDESKTTLHDLEKNVVTDRIGLIPEWTRLVTAGVDTQDNGFYVSVSAFGADNLHRVIDAYFLDCNMNVANSEDIEHIFKKNIEDRVFSDIKKRQWKIGLWSIDTGGHRTKQIYAACARLERVILVKGAHNTQRTTIQYSSDINLYMVRTGEYLEETEDKSTSYNGSFEVAKGFSPDFFQQFINSRKVRHKNKKTGEETIVWVKKGQNDYRMAVVHAFICLDIPTSYGTFRFELNKKDFSYNPISKSVEESVIDIEVLDEDFDDVFDDVLGGSDTQGNYDIGSFKEGW